MKRLLLAATALIALSGTASAVTITAADIGNTGVTTFNGLVGGNTLVPELGGSMTLGLTSIGAGNVWNFSYSFTNTTAQPFTSSISGFGFNTAPELVGVSATGLFANALMNVNVSGGVGHIDFCATAGPTCNGGASNGVDPGATVTGTFSLDFADLPALTSISITDGFIRFQEITGPGYNGASGVGFGDLTVTTVAAVPEASTWAMMLLGFVGIGALGMRQRRKFRLA